MMLNKPELISPAGDWSSLHSALEAGADSVYFGVKGLNMRNLARNFDLSEMKKIMAILHKGGKKGYLTLNVIIYNKELNRVKQILKEAKKAGVDAIILWDLGVLAIAKEMGFKIHLSTQASVANILALKYYYQQGVKRVILARECSLAEIKNIISNLKKDKIACQIETFIHGAMCISISGRCLLSQYSFGKSANRGECLQPCRREFTITDSDNYQYIIGKDYLLSSKDLCTIDFIEPLIKSGISAFKIEGRRRSSEYIKIVTSVYRRAIDCFFSGKLDSILKKELKEELISAYNRGFCDGFYWGIPKDSLSRTPESNYEKIFIGQVKKFYKKINVAEIKVLNESLKKDSQILCVGKTTPASFARVYDIQINHKFVDILLKGQTGGVKLPFIARSNDKVFLWQKKENKS
ncbi:MAG: U32 family peptidase [Candidatus Omnitrophica bacterium]|jgi:putative protease|nr:U32 family peptidase [Candidatus Omnitrophota bacterium]